MEWDKYYEIQKDKGPSALLVEAVSYCGQREYALDLGAGPLNDTKWLLGRGFHVVAIDSSPTMAKLASFINDSRFQPLISSFDDYPFPIETFDLINAHWSLPFEAPQAFGQMFNKLKKALKHSGIFVGQFYGIKDAWNVPKTRMSFHSRDRVEELLSGMEVLKLDEELENIAGVCGQSKLWHVFHVIARRVS
jgi:tellurite methyltransferase